MLLNNERFDINMTLKLALNGYSASVAIFL